MRALVVLLSKHNQQAMVSLYKIPIMKCGTPIWTNSFIQELYIAPFFSELTSGEAFNPPDLLNPSL
jgi:hypothetical protein